MTYSEAHSRGHNFWPPNNQTSHGVYIHEVLIMVCIFLFKFHSLIYVLEIPR